MKKFLAPLLLSGVIVVAFAAPGSASVRHGSVVTGCSFTVNPPNGNAGDNVNLVGTGFQDSATLPITINGVVEGSVTTDAAGAFNTNIVLPAGGPPYTITIPCGAGGGSSTASGTVGDPGSAATAALAFTGSGDSTSNIVAGALAAIVVGAVLVLGTRRRAAMRRRTLVG